MDVQGSYEDGLHPRREEGESKVDSDSDPACLRDEQSNGLTNQYAFLTVSEEDRDKLKMLESLPVVRSIPWRKAPERELVPKDERMQVRAGILLVQKGLIAEKPCDVCARGGGVFSSCVVLNKLFMGSCATCKYSSHEHLCSLREYDDPFFQVEVQTPSPSIQQRPRKGSESVRDSPLVHRSPPAHSGKGVITFEDFEPPEKTRTKRAAAASAAAAISHDLAQFAAMNKINKREENFNRRLSSSGNRRETKSHSFSPRAQKTTARESGKFEKLGDGFFHYAPETEAGVSNETINPIFDESLDNEDEEPVNETNSCQKTVSSHPAEHTQSDQTKQIHQPLPEQPKSKMRLMIEEKARELKRKLDLGTEKDSIVDRMKKLKKS